MRAIEVSFTVDWEVLAWCCGVVYFLLCACTMEAYIRWTDDDGCRSLFAGLLWPLTWLLFALYALGCFVAWFCRGKGQP